MRHRDVEREQLDRIALPNQRLAAGGKMQPRQVRDRARRRVFTRNPFRIEQGQRARCGGNVQFSVIDLPRCLGGIDMQDDRRAEC